jgi:hypothetical protein
MISTARKQVLLAKTNTHPSLFMQGRLQDPTAKSENPQITAPSPQIMF